MKTRKVSKKLTLSKETIADLRQMSDVKGGVLRTLVTTVGCPCLPTVKYCDHTEADCSLPC